MKKLIFVIVGLTFAFTSSQITYATQLEGSVSGGSGATVPSHVAAMPSSGGSSGITYGGTTTSSLGSFNIAINAGPGLAPNSAALAAFERAAGQWESRISDSITVNIDANMSNLGSSSIIGQASTVMLYDSYTIVRDAVVADAAAETDDQIVSYLPTAANFNATLPDGFGLDGELVASKANFKALGFTGLDAEFGATDGSITLNRRFDFDFDNSDGVTSGYMDFETVAAHEIGHILGFISTVDAIDEYLESSSTPNISPTTLDLFRFDNNGADDPSTTAEFSTFTRSLVPNNDEITDQISTPWGDLSDAEFRMATGKYNGDGRQASHWKDDLGIGVMDPTLNYVEVVGVSEADFRAFDLIGYDIAPVPEPGQFVMLLGLAVTWFVWRRLRR